MPSAKPTPTVAPMSVIQPDLTQHHAADVRRIGAERHPHAELARALRDREREHAVEADRREHAWRASRTPPRAS